MTRYETLSIVVAVLSLVVSTVVLLFLIWQIRLLRSQVDDSRVAQVAANVEANIENGRVRQRSTMNFVAGTMGKWLDLYHMIPAAGSPKQAQFLADAMIRDTPEFVALRNYLNYLEDLSIGVNMNIFDKDVIYRSVGGRMRRAWVNYSGWIVVERGVLNQSLYSELEQCVNELTARP